jgi:uncharacterized membrane protein YoaK (UPF0700 family)
MLAHQLEVRLPRWHYLYPFIFILLGLASAYRIRGRGYRDGVFATVFFLSLGAFFFLRNFGFIPYIYRPWPTWILAAGLGLCAQYFFVPRQWGVLVPGTVLLFLGGASLLYELDYWYFFDLAKFWPVILIAFGLGILLNALRRHA